jgi:hypothetical protein
MIISTREAFDVDDCNKKCLCQIDHKLKTKTESDDIISDHIKCMYIKL